MSPSHDIEGSGSGYYAGGIKSEQYHARINTPARNPEYYAAYNKPLIERAKKVFGTPIRLLDIACGPASELDFVKDDPEIQIFATDISPDIVAEVRERLGENALVFVSDARHPVIRSGSMDAGILMNAMVYEPGHMLSAMHDALKPNAECTVNLRIFRSKKTEHKYVDRGARLYDHVYEYTINGEKHTFPVKVFDFRECVKEDGTPDMQIRNLGEQVYFTSPEDAERLVRLIGFSVVDYSRFEFVTSAAAKSKDDVFVIRKES